VLIIKEAFKIYNGPDPYRRCFGPHHNHYLIVSTLSLLVVAKVKIQEILNFIFSNPSKQIVPCKSTVEEVSFEWSHHRISSTDSKVSTTFYNNNHFIFLPN